MKRYILISTLSLLVTFVSCGDFLDIKPESNISTSNYFKTVKDFEMCLTGVYNTLISAETQSDDRYGSYFYGFLVMGRVGTDELMVNNGNNGEPEIGSYTYTPENVFVSRVWYMMYRGIQRANVIIDRMKTINFDISAADKNRILGEAHFLRGFFYFHLVKFYGEVPLVTMEVTDLTQINYNKATIKEVYNQIEADLSQSIDFLPENNKLGHANKYAAKALLGKVYLQMAGFPLKEKSAASKSAHLFKEIIQSGKYSLIKAKSEDQYFSLFDASNEHNSEYIWDIEFSNADGTNRFGGQVGTTEGVVTPVNLYWSKLRSNQEFYETFEENDIRRNSIARFRYIYAEDGKTLIRDYAAQAVANRYSAYKFRHPLKEEDRGAGWANWSNPINFPIIRYADILLCCAEALYRENNTPTSEALDLVNQVRRRAFLIDINTPSSDVDLNIYNSSEFEKALLNERAWELCFEGHRWTDLVRFEKLEEGVKVLSKYKETIQTTMQAKNIKRKHYFFPIPQDVIDASSGKIKQNPEWL